MCLWQRLEEAGGLRVARQGGGDDDAGASL